MVRAQRTNVRLALGNISVGSIIRARGAKSGLIVGNLVILKELPVARNPRIKRRINRKTQLIPRRTRKDN